MRVLRKHPLIPTLIGMLILSLACDTVPTEPEAAETTCDDGNDNDRDGLVDCDDPDCGGVASCPRVEAYCNDGVDDDVDGLVDCLDTDCCVDAACLDEAGHPKSASCWMTLSGSLSIEKMSDKFNNFEVLCTSTWSLDGVSETYVDGTYCPDCTYQFQGRLTWDPDASDCLDGLRDDTFPSGDMDTYIFQAPRNGTDNYFTGYLVVTGELWAETGRYSPLTSPVVITGDRTGGFTMAVDYNDLYSSAGLGSYYYYYYYWVLQAEGSI